MRGGTIQPVLNNNDKTGLDRIPPGPWTWQRVRPADGPNSGPDDFFPASTDEEGIALVAGDGTWVLWSAGGYGSPELHSKAVQDVLRGAWQIPDLVRELDEVARKLDEARRVARSLYDAAGRLPLEDGDGQEAAPEWLMRPDSPAGL